MANIQVVESLGVAVFKTIMMDRVSFSGMESAWYKKHSLTNLNSIVRNRAALLAKIPGVFNVVASSTTEMKENHELVVLGQITYTMSDDLVGGFPDIPDYEEPKEEHYPY